METCTYHLPCSPHSIRAVCAHTLVSLLILVQPFVLQMSGTNCQLLNLHQGTAVDVSWRAVSHLCAKKSQMWFQRRPAQVVRGWSYMFALYKGTFHFSLFNTSEPSAAHVFHVWTHGCEHTHILSFPISTKLGHNIYCVNEFLFLNNEHGVGGIWGGNWVSV